MTSLILLSGMLLLGGGVIVALALVPSPPSLQPALDRVGGAVSSTERQNLVVDAGSRSERLGAALYRRSPVPLTVRQRQQLRLQDKSIAEFYADKIVMAGLGAIMPALVGFT